MRSRKYVPGILIEGRGLRGPKGDKGDSLNVTEISSYITGYMSNYADSTHSHGSVSGYNITATSASNGLTLSVSNPAVALNRVLAGDYISLSYFGASTTISVTGLQPAGAYLTTAAATDHTHGSISTATVTGNGLLNTSASNGLTLGIPNYLTTAAESWHSHNDLYVPLNVSSDFAMRTHVHSNNLLTTITGEYFHISGDSDGSTFSQPRWITTAALSNHTHGNVYGVNVTGISASNGLTLSVGNYLSTNYSTHTHSQYVGLNTAVTGALATINTSGISLNITGGGGTGGVAIGNTATVPFTSGSVQFSGANVTVNTSQGTGTQSTNQYIQLSVADPSAAANSVAAGDYISLSTNGATTTVSVTGLQATSAMSNYFAVSNSSNLIAVSNSSNFIPQSSAASFFLDAYSTLLQLTANNSLSLDTSYTSHTHSQYINTSDSSLFLGTGYTTHSHATSTHTHGSVAITGGIGITSASSGLSVSIPSYLTTAANSTHTHGNVSLSLASLSGTYSSASNGLTLSLTNSTHSHPYVNTSESGNVYFVNASGSNITFSSATSGNSTSIFATAGGGTGGSGGVYIRNSATTITSGTAYLSNTNGISWGISGNTITASYDKGSVYFTDGSNVTWGSSVVGYNTSIFLTAAGGTGGGGGLAAIYDGTNAISGGSAYFSNSNGVSFGINGSTVTASYDKGSVYFTNGSNVTWSSSVSGNNTSVMVTAGGAIPLYVSLGNVGTSGTKSTITNGTIYLEGFSNATVFQDSNTIGIYGPNNIAIQGLGNTASSNAFTSGSVMVSGANLTVNTSVNGENQYLQVSAPPMGYLYFANIAGFSFVTTISGVSTTVGISTE